MKIFLKFLLILKLAIITCGCNRSTDTEYHRSRLLETHNLIAIDTIRITYDEDFFMGTPVTFHVWQSYILVNDMENACVWIFDRNFNFIEKLGSHGTGPGEFSHYPVPLPDEEHLWLIDHNTKQMYRYDVDFQLVASARMPDELYILPISPVKIDANRYVMSAAAAGSYPQSDVRYYEKIKSLFVLDPSFEIIDTVLAWDDIYFDSDYHAFTFSNFLTNVTEGQPGTLYAQQGASFIIHKIDSAFEKYGHSEGSRIITGYHNPVCPFPKSSKLLITSLNSSTAPPYIAIWITMQQLDICSLHIPQ